MSQPGSSIDCTVEALVVHRDRVLLRKHERYGIWLSVGGHIEPGEGPNEAAIREVREEVGLEVMLAGEPDAARLAGEAATAGGPEYRWFTRAEIEASFELAPWLKTYALAALDALSGG